MKKKILIVIPFFLLFGLAISATVRVFDANKKWRDEHTDPVTEAIDEPIDTVYWDDLWTKNY